MGYDIVRGGSSDSTCSPRDDTVKAYELLTNTPTPNTSTTIYWSTNGYQETTPLIYFPFLTLPLRNETQ